MYSYCAIKKILKRFNSLNINRFKNDFANRYIYYLMTKALGIEIMECKLKDDKHFAMTDCMVKNYRC